MRETRIKELDGMTFKVTQLPAMRSVKLLHRLGKAVGPALLKALGTGGSLKSIDVGALADASQLLFDRLSEDDLERMTRELLEVCTVSVNGKELPLMPVFDETLAGKPATVFKVLKFALEVNYSDFLGALRAAAPVSLGA